MQTIADSRSLISFFGERTREAGPIPRSLLRLRIQDPTPGTGGLWLPKVLRD